MSNSTEAQPDDEQEEAKRLALLLDRMNSATEKEPGFERGLYHLLKAHQSVLPYANHYFQKAFRQIDITGSGHLDMAIWQALHDSDVFWNCFESVQDEKVIPEE